VNFQINAINDDMVNNRTTAEQIDQAQFKRKLRDLTGRRVLSLKFQRPDLDFLVLEIDFQGIKPLMHNAQFGQLARDQITRDRHGQKYEPKHEGKDHNAEDDQNAVPRTAFRHV